MRYIYVTRIDITPGEIDGGRVVYGIDAVNTEDGSVLSSISGIFDDLKEADAVVHILNEERLELVHLPDVVNDIITKAHM